MPYPDLVMIGPPKCGTTSVFNWLSEHSQVCTSSVKETYHFFQRDEEENGIKIFSEADFSHYQTYFKDCSENMKCIVEATPEYLYSESAINAFKKIEKPIKFLFIYRDPADRMFSDYQFHRYKTKRFKGSFEKYIGYNQGIFEGKKTKQGFYKKFLNNWINAFGSDRIIQRTFDDLKKNPVQFMKSLAEDIGIDAEEFERLNLLQKNKTVKIRNRNLHMKLLKFTKILPQQMIDTLSPIYYTINSGAIPKKTDKEKKLIKELRRYYASE